MWLLLFWDRIGRIRKKREEKSDKRPFKETHRTGKRERTIGLHNFDDECLIRNISKFLTTPCQEFHLIKNSFISILI